MARTIAIMQPYFMPYAGYFRLFEAADLFVFYDCVQFPRRGWVHRNKLTHRNGSAAWLTLPLVKLDRDNTRITDLRFADNAQEEWNMRMAEFPALSNQNCPNISFLPAVEALTAPPCDYIINGLITVCQLLGIECTFARSSELALPDSIRGQDRILAIAKHYNADIYINAPGGRELYEEKIFSETGLALKFLPDYQGNFNSILERLMTEPAHKIAEEIRSNL